MGHEPDRNDWLGRTLRRSPAASPEACLDAETLAAWADGTLHAQAAAAVEAHASSCARCMAVLAAMERTAPAVPARHAWTRARLFRWLVPMAAAAAAVAIWVVVPDRPIAPEQPAQVRDFQAERAESDAQALSKLTEPELAPVPVPGPVPREGMSNQSTAPSAQDVETQSLDKARPQSQLAEEFRREQAETRALGAAAEAPPPAAAPVAPPPVAADSLAATPALRADRSGFNAPLARESAAASDPSIRWRVLGSATVERSTNGGKTWTRTTSPSTTITAVRAVDSDRAVVTTSDNTEFYTSDAGVSWTRVQENSPAPF